MLIAIEGIDGSGKGTVTKRLQQEAGQIGWKADQISFPRYESTLYGDMVGRYLNGDFGRDTHPILSGTLYSIDRFESKAKIDQMCHDNELVLLGRYVTSNLCYMAMKATEGEEASIVEHFVNLEYGIFQLPVPDLIIFLDVPVEMAMANVRKKDPRSYTADASDIHEADAAYLARVRNFYLHELMKFHPATRFEIVNCVRDEQLITLDDVFQKVQGIVFDLVQTHRKKG